MYGLPKSFDASHFIGLTLEQVSFTANTIHFSFSERVSITLESNFEHHLKTRKAVQGNIPVFESQLMQLIGETVISSSAETNGTLTLRFSDGQALICYDNSSMYESYRLKFVNEEIVV